MAAVAVKVLDALLDASAAEQVRRLRRGLPAATFGQVARALRVPKRSLALRLGLNVRTLSRRTSRLSTEESEKQLRAYRVFRLATRVLGSPEEARAWLDHPAPALGGEKPLDVLDTEPGAEAVVNLLNAIHWGVYL